MAFEQRSNCSSPGEEKVITIPETTYQSRMITSQQVLVGSAIIAEYKHPIMKNLVFGINRGRSRNIPSLCFHHFVTSGSVHPYFGLLHHILQISVNAMEGGTRTASEVEGLIPRFKLEKLLNQGLFIPATSPVSRADLSLVHRSGWPSYNAIREHRCEAGAVDCRASCLP